MTGKQLKNAILQLAIQGKLVPQDANDEPASVLLAKIRKEKEQLVKAGKKDLETTPIADEEKPFEIPESWEWVRLGEIGIFERGNGIKRDETFSSGKPCVRYGEMYTKYRYNPTFDKTFSYTSPAVFNKCRKAHNGDLFMALTGENKQDIALAAQYTGNEEIAVGGDLCHFSILQAYALYFVYVINSQFFSDKKELLATGDIIVHISADKLGSIPIPLPPLAEQHRIVSKIEELMPLVEEYGVAQEKLNRLNEALPEALKKSILQQAIQGKLVPQDANDEPASALLSRIRKEKEQLVKAGKLKKKDLATTPITDEEKPFEIPESWEWVRLGECVSNRAGLAYNKGDLDKKTSDMIRVLRGGNISYGSWKKEANDVMIAREFVNDELLLKKGTFITPAVTSLENMGKTALIDEDLYDTVVGGFVLMLQSFFYENSLLKYLLYFFCSAYYKEYCKSITNKSGQAFYNISRAKLMNLPIPIPPLAEQHRIVAKIEELMAMVDGMK